MVYAITTLEFEFIKIGQTKNFKQRLRNIQSGCPFRLGLWIACNTKEFKRVEKEAHELLDNCHYRGEWFAPNEDDLDRIQDYLQSEINKTKDQYKKDLEEFNRDRL